MRTLYLGFLGLLVVGCGSSANAGKTDAGGTGGQSTASGGTGTTATGGTVATSGGSAGSGSAGQPTTGGTTSENGGSASAGTAGSDSGGTAPYNVLDCDSIGEVGEWENITPPDVASHLDGNPDHGMTNRFALDPINPGTVYLGTNRLGIWKTTDCGASWIHVNTGTGGEAMDCSLQWNLKIDPVESNVLYASAGYGCMGSGLWKSTTSGVDWEEVWPANAGIEGVNGFVGSNVVDPENHLHLLLSFHEAPNIGESTDGGESWNLIEWGGNAVWLLDSTTWLSSKNDSIWRTSDSGVTWNEISGAVSNSHSEGFMYKADDGTFYLGSQQGVVRSTDGIDWEIIPNSGNLVKGVTGDGTSIFASSGGVPWNLDNAIQPYLVSPESDGTAFSLYPSPEMNPGADNLQSDRAHHILYSSNCHGGFWRVRTQ